MNGSGTKKLVDLLWSEPETEVAQLCVSVQAPAAGVGRQVEVRREVLFEVRQRKGRGKVNAKQREVGAVCEWCAVRRQRTRPAVESAAPCVPGRRWCCVRRQVRPAPAPLRQCRQ